MGWTFACPRSFQFVQKWGDGYALRERDGGIRVIIDCSEKVDGNMWLHVSYSRADRVPDHADTCKVKAAFLGDRYAYAVFPPAGQYVNIHPNCLHLWARLDGQAVLPEFSAVVDGIGSI